MLAPDGRYEQNPLVPVQLAAADLDVLGRAARGLGAAARTFAVGDALEEASHIGPHLTPTALVEHVARLHGVLDLEFTEDARTLLPRLQDSLVSDVVLTPSEDAAYRRTADRINTMWTGSALDRWAY